MSAFDFSECHVCLAGHFGLASDHSNRLKLSPFLVVHFCSGAGSGCPCGTTNLEWFKSQFFCRFQHFSDSWQMKILSARPSLSYPSIRRSRKWPPSSTRALSSATRYLGKGKPQLHSVDDAVSRMDGCTLSHGCAAYEPRGSATDQTVAHERFSAVALNRRACPRAAQYLSTVWIQPSVKS